MKKLLALVLVLSLFAALAACTQVTRISIENPAEIKLEKAGDMLGSIGGLFGKK